MIDEWKFQFDPDDIGLTEPSRRDFLKTSGCLTILFMLSWRETNAQGGNDYPDDLNAFLKINADGRITCFTGKIEMGQGIITSLAQMLAEELDAPLAAIDMVMGDTALCPYDGGTVGSRTTKYFGPALRRAGAAAKTILLNLAAERLEAEPEQLVVTGAVVSLPANPAKKISYAELVQGRKIEHKLAAEPMPESYKKHTITGKPEKRSDAVAKVTGTAQFTGDIRPPEMLYAHVLRPPAHGAVFKSADTSAAKKVPGIQVVEEGDFVAVLHALPDVAARAMSLIKADFVLPPGEPNNTTIFAHLEKIATSERVVTENGDLNAGRAASVKIFEQSYFNHYVAHAPIETHTALAQQTGDGMTLWVSTQTPFRVRQDVAEFLEMPADKVRIITPFVGGGFGGKKSGQFILDAARLAKLTGRPVQVQLSRKEEFFYDTFRPAALVQARSGIDKNGRITFWHFAHLFPGTRSSEPIYNIPHFRVVSKSGERGEAEAHPFGTGAWRGPGSNTNVFAMESHTDVMAAAAGIDPLTFRLQNLNDKRMIRVLKAAAEKFDRKFSPAPSGKGYGIACTNYLNCYVATMAEVAVNKQTGHVQVKRMVCAQDMGEVINPLGATLQVEGGLMMGLGYCLSEEIHFSGGQILDENFDTYDMTRFSWAPNIEVVLIDNPDLAPQGGGEPAITTSGAVIANAVFDAIGVRLTILPMTPARIKAALVG